MSMLEPLLKTIVDGSVMTDEAKIAFATLLSRMTQLQHTENAVFLMRKRSQPFVWRRFPKPDGRWLMNEANLFPKATNEL